MRVVLSRRADEDVEEILTFTREVWGDAQMAEYAGRLNAALVTLGEDPRRGRPVPRHPGIFHYTVKRPGRNARHVVFFRVSRRTLTVLRVLHDGMDFDRHLP